MPSRSRLGLVSRARFYFSLRARFRAAFQRRAPYKGCQRAIPDDMRVTPHGFLVMAVVSIAN